MLELVVVRVPDFQKSQEITLGIDEAAVRLFGGLFLVHRTFARVLDAEAGGDDKHFGENARPARRGTGQAGRLSYPFLGRQVFFDRLDDHAADGGVDREAGQVPTKRSELLPFVEGTEFEDYEALCAAAG